MAKSENIKIGDRIRIIHLRHFGRCGNRCSLTVCLFSCVAAGQRRDSKYTYCCKYNDFFLHIITPFHSACHFFAIRLHYSIGLLHPSILSPNFHILPAAVQPLNGYILSCFFRFAWFKPFDIWEYWLLRKLVRLIASSPYFPLIASMAASSFLCFSVSASPKRVI